jgi:excisionase family DNA binding protein
MADLQEALREMVRAEVRKALDERLGPAANRFAGQALTVGEACKRLSCGRAYLSKLRASGRIRSVKFGKRAVRIPAEEVERLLAGSPAERLPDNVELLARARRRAAG